ncbi:MFS transporter [Chloroflexota bacterium]
MIKKRKFPKIFFGWWTVIAGGILALWGHGYHAYGISALFTPISSDLGFTRAQTAIPTSIGRLEGGLEGPLSGWITDKYGPRWPILLGVFLVGLGLVLMNYIDSLWGFYIVWGVILGTGTNIALTIPVHTAITNWFVKKRGVALSIQSVMSGLSGMLVMPLIAWLIIDQGWRSTCLIGGIVMWVVGLPLTWFFFKRYRPEYYGLLPDGATEEEQAEEKSQMVERGVKYAEEVEEVEFTLRQALRTPAYWMLVAGNSVHSLSVQAMNVHTIPFLTDLGLDPLVAAGMMAFMIGIGIPARFAGGFIIDHIRKNYIRHILALTYILQTVGFVIVLLNQSIPMIWLFFIFFGLGKGLGQSVNTLVKARYFGRKAFGSIRGTSMMFMTPFSILAPIYCGWVYDTTGSYISAFTVFAVIGFISIALIMFAIPPKSPAQITDIRKIT